MGDLPRILARTDVPNAPAFPRVPAGAMGAPWATLAEIGAALRKEQTPIDATKDASDWNVEMEDLKNKVQAENPNDPSNWRQAFRAGMAEKQAGKMQGIDDPLRKKALQIHINKTFDTHVLDLSKQGALAARAKALGDMEIAENDLSKQAAQTTNPRLEAIYRDDYENMIKTAERSSIVGGRPMPPQLTPLQAEQRREQFQQKYLTYKADGEIERDASAFLNNVNKDPQYAKLDPEKKRILTSRANTAISSQIARENRDQKQRQEQSDREVQDLFDTGTSADVIQAKLVADTRAGIMDRNQRAYWDNRLIRGEKADDPVQIRNADKLRADFLEGGMPTGARIRDFRNQTKAMRGDGRIGDKGSSMVNNVLLQAESHLNAEGRAQRSEGRAIESAARAREREGGGGKMSTAAAAQLIARPFPNSNPNNPQLAGHKADMKELLERSNAGIGTEDRGVVAKEITDRRLKQIEGAKQQQKQRAEAAKTDPVAASILERAKQLKQNK